MLPLVFGLAMQTETGLPKQEFVSTVSSLGYRIDEFPKVPERWIVEYGGIRATLTGGIAPSKNIVGYTIEFELDLPNALAPKRAKALREAPEKHGISFRTYLDGGITLYQEVRFPANKMADCLSHFFADAEDLETATSDMHPKPLDPVNGHHPWAPLNPDALMDPPAARDIEYLIRNFSWQPKHGFGFSSNGWVELANIDGQDIWFHELVNPEFYAVPQNHHGCYEEFVGRYDEAWVAKWVADHKSKIDWAHVEDEGDGRLGITALIDTTGGMTVREFTRQATGFVSRLKTLGLPKTN